jgi:hypothetical protein
MDVDGVSAGLPRKKKASTDAHRESAHSAKVERGRVKRQHRQNTLVYYASTRNRDNATPLEIVRNVPTPISAAGSGASNNQVLPSAESTLRESPPPPTAAPMGSDAVASSPAESSDARHGGVLTCIVISSTSEDGGANATGDLQEVSNPDSYEDVDEDGESVNPKKKPRKNYDLTRKFQ